MFTMIERGRRNRPHYLRLAKQRPQLSQTGGGRRQLLSRPTPAV
jgi:hypothetical protein